MHWAYFGHILAPFGIHLAHLVCQFLAFFEHDGYQLKKTKITRRDQFSDDSPQKLCPTCFDDISVPGGASKNKWTLCVVGRRLVFKRISITLHKMKLVI